MLHGILKALFAAEFLLTFSLKEKLFFENEMRKYTTHFISLEGPCSMNLTRTP